MKATRVAVRQAKTLEELCAQLADVQTQLNRIEDMLAGRHEGTLDETPPPDAEPNSAVELVAKPVERPARRRGA